MRTDWNAFTAVSLSATEANATPATLEKPATNKGCTMFVNHNGTFVAGNPTFNNLIAVIGSRAATAYGMQIAKDIGEHLAKHYTVCSGLAFGIEVAAHRGALTTGGTIGFLPSTITYPAAHKFVA